MTTVKDIYDYIDSFAPFESAEEWDNVGILIGDKSAEVKKVLLALDITNDVADEAVQRGAQLIISHHPIIFGGLKRVMVGSAVYNAVRNSLSCVSAHTNLDKSPSFGVNMALAEGIGLTDCAPADDGGILFEAYTEKTMTSAQLAQQIKERLNTGGLCCTDCCNAINKVGLCSGAGGSEVYEAAKNGCDAFVTGEIKHHELLFANESGMSVFILGHYQSEDVVIAPLAAKLKQRFPEVDFIKSEIFTDHVNYI